jgi:quinoprotein glucose dehydrogenase
MSQCDDRGRPLAGPTGHVLEKPENAWITGRAQTSGVGVLVTKTLAVMGDPTATTTQEHPRGAMLRAYDKATGRQVGGVLMPAPQSGSPMTYMVDGKQYIVVAISVESYSGEYLALSLPE